jgi:hypothetical protein
MSFLHICADGLENTAMAPDPLMIQNLNERGFVRKYYWPIVNVHLSREPYSEFVSFPKMLWLQQRNWNRAVISNSF